MRLLAILGVLIAGSLAAALADAAPSQQRTHPRVRPVSGHRHTSFTVSFVLRARPGHSGVTETAYSVAVAPARRGPARCLPPAPDPVRSGAPGSIARVALPAPRGGWCRRRYRATVFLQRGPYCPAPAPGQPPQPCPEFATQAIDTGSATFVVR